MQALTLTFIGGGRMANALISGLVDAEIEPSSIRVIDPNPEVRTRLQQQWGIEVSETPNQESLDCDIVVLAIKPQTMAQALTDIAPWLDALHQPMIISVASGISLASLQGALGHRPMIRSMPNTPAIVGAGITAMVANDAVQLRHKEWAETLMGHVGQYVWLDKEADLDLVTAISGSGPAYFFALAEHMIQAAIARGLSPALAKTLVHQTAYGAGRLLAQPQADAKTLRVDVTSPGGTTEAALNVFESREFQHIVDEAVGAAHLRAQDLGQSMASSPSQETI